MQDTNLATASHDLEDSAFSCVDNSGGAYVGQLTKQGDYDFGPAGMARFYDAEFEVRAVIYGEHHKTIKGSYLVLRLQSRPYEELPQVGKEFVVVSQPTGADFHFSKLLPATPENVALVRAAINRALAKRSNRIEEQQASTNSANKESPPQVASLRNPANVATAPSPIQSVPVDWGPLPLVLLCIVLIVGILALWLRLRTKRQ